MNITKEQGILIKAIAIIMIVVFHFQYDMFGGSFLMERGQGAIAWISNSFNYIEQEPNAWIGIILSLCFVVGFIFLGNIHTMFISDFLFALGGIMLAYLITKPLKGHAKNALSFIGKKSYLIYLYHEPTMKLILKFIFPNWINS